MYKFYLFITVFENINRYSFPYICLIHICVLLLLLIENIMRKFNKPTELNPDNLNGGRKDEMK